MNNPVAAGLYNYKRFFFGVFFVVAVSLTAAGVYYYLHLLSVRRIDAEAQLLSIETIKVREVQDWRADRLEAAKSLVGSPLFERQLRDLISNPSSAAPAALIKSRLNAYISQTRYLSASIVDLDGKHLLRAGAAPGISREEVVALVNKIRASGRAELGEFFLPEASKHPHIALGVPALTGQPQGPYLLLEVDPGKFLYPLLQTWPAKGESGEILLVRREGDNVLFLNDLRHKPDAALRLRIPLSNELLPAAQALKGLQGLFAGTDYRGKRVLSAVSPVPGTEWAVITKMDWDEIMKGRGNEAILLSLALLGLIGFAGSGFYYLFTRQAAQYRTAARTADSKLQLSENRFRLFFEHSPLGMSMTTLDGRVNVNKAFCDMLGYSEQELRGKRWQDITHKDDVAATEAIVRKIAEGKLGSVQFEKRYIRKNGQLMHAEVTTAANCGESGRPEYLITTVNDITARKEAQAKALESETRFSQLFETMEEGFATHEIICDAQGRPVDYRFLEVNPAFERLTGLKRGDVVGRTVLEVMPSIEKVWIENYGKVALGGTPVYFESYSAQMEKWYAVSAFRPRQGQFAVSFFDITRRKKAEDALRASENAVRNKLDAIMSPEGDIGSIPLEDIFDIPALQGMMDEMYELTHITSAILDIDGKVLVASGWQDICTKFHRVNPETCRNCLESDTILTRDIRPGEVKSYFCKNNMRDVSTPLIVGGAHVGNFFLGQFLYEDDPRDVEKFREQARRYGFDEEEYLAAYGRIPVFSRRNVEVLISFYRQVAELVSRLSYGKIKLARALAQSKKAVDDLRASEEDKKITLENLLVGVVVHAADTSILSSNPEAQRILGLTEAQITGKTAVDPAWMFLNPDLSRMKQEDFPVNRIVASKARVSDCMLGIRRPDLESVTWVNAGGVPVFDAHGALDRVIVNFVDITQRTVLEAEKQQLTDALLKKNKEMENFLYITTHDLRSPLVNIQGFSQNLQRYLVEIGQALEASVLPQERKEQARKLTAEKVPEALAFVLESSAKMDALLNALLRVSRLGRQELKPETLDMGQMLRQIVDTMLFQVRDAGAEINIGPLPPCRADAVSVNQLFSNLLDNAVKYRDAGRSLVVEVSGETRGGKAVYRVEDNGQGIPAADLERLWDVFYKPGRPAQKNGEGIGLPICRRIAERNSGGIRVEANPGGGSVFVVELPAA